MVFLPLLFGCIQPVCFSYLLMLIYKKNHLISHNMNSKKKKKRPLNVHALNSCHSDQKEL